MIPPKLKANKFDIGLGVYEEKQYRAVFALTQEIKKNTAADTKLTYNVQLLEKTFVHIIRGFLNVNIYYKTNLHLHVG